MNAVKNIWLIDDDDIFVFLTSRLLERMADKKEITIFKNGQQAIDHFRQSLADNATLPDIIFLDLMMPVLDGWGFLEEYIPLCLQFTKEITLYVLSSSVSPQDLMRAKAIKEVKNYIIKPLSITHLQEWILRSKLRQLFRSHCAGDFGSNCATLARV